jgi:hypothetical protein
MTRSIKSTTRSATRKAHSLGKTLSKRASSSGINGSRSRSSSSLLGLPLWASVSLGCAAFGGLVYGLMQFDSVSDMLDPVIHDVGEFFGLTDDNGIDTMNITHDRNYSSAVLS